MTLPVAIENNSELNGEKKLFET